MSASCSDAMLAYALRTVEAKRTEEEEATKIERAYDSLLKERLEKEREWLEELERHSATVRSGSSAMKSRTRTAPSHWRSNNKKRFCICSL